MKISTKGRYGLRLMVELAISSMSCEKPTPVPLKEIARNQDISDKYLEQIVTSLNKAELVKSVRGAQGGYIIGKAADEITVGDILRAVEGPLTIVDCVGDDDHCDKYDACAAGFVWREIAAAVEQVVDNITLCDLAKRDNSKCNCV